MVKLVTDGIFDGELENGRSLKNLGVASDQLSLVCQLTASPRRVKHFISNPTPQEKFYQGLASPARKATVGCLN